MTDRAATYKGRLQKMPGYTDHFNRKFRLFLMATSALIHLIVVIPYLINWMSVVTFIAHVFLIINPNA